MKELSIEEKAKAYDEAIKRVNDLISRCKTNRDRRTMIYRVDDIESIFPELKESEDERIRKDMIETIKKEAHDFPASVIAEKSKSWLSWLEKQSNQKPYGQRQECVDCQFNYAGECKGSCAMKISEEKPTYKVEPKEWSDEDEKFINRTIMYLRQYNSSESEVKRQSTQSCINWLEALRDEKLNDPSIIKYKIGDKVQFYTDGAVYTISKVENGKYIFADGGDDASIYEELIPVEESKDTLTRYNVKCGDYLSHKDGTIIKVHDIDCFDRIHFFYYANDMSEDGGQIQDNRAFMAHCGIIQDCRFATEDEIDFLEKWVAHKKYIWVEDNVSPDDEEED